MRFVIDTNEYLFAFGLLKVPSSEEFIAEVLKHPHIVTVRIPRKIVEEVRAHLAGETFREFIDFLKTLEVTIDEDFSVPFEFGVTYEARGLKPADAFIAAYAEWVGADVLVTENRHFLSLHIDLPFRILSAEKCIKLLKAKKGHL